MHAEKIKYYDIYLNQLVHQVTIEANAKFDNDKQIKMLIKRYTPNGYKWDNNFQLIDGVIRTNVWADPSSKLSEDSYWLSDIAKQEKLGLI